MPKVLKKDIKSRAKELRDLAKKQHINFLEAQVGTIQNVLVEKNFVGHAENFAKIKLKEFTQTSEIVSTRILEINSDYLIGTPHK